MDGVSKKRRCLLVLQMEDDNPYPLAGGALPLVHKKKKSGGFESMGKNPDDLWLFVCLECLRRVACCNMGHWLMRSGESFDVSLLDLELRYVYAI